MIVKKDVLLLMNTILSPLNLKVAHSQFRFSKASHFSALMLHDLRQSYLEMAVYVSMITSPSILKKKKYFFLVIYCRCGLVYFFRKWLCQCRW